MFCCMALIHYSNNEGEEISYFSKDKWNPILVPEWKPAEEA